MRRFLAVALLTICCGCTTIGSRPQGPSVIVVSESRRVQLTEPNEVLRFSAPGVWMERGRYIELCEAEMLAIEHGLVK